MKNIMGFVKKRWPLIVSIVVILVALPAGWIVSSNLNAGIKQRQESLANSLLSSLDGLRVTYDLPAPVDGMEPVQYSGMPHEQLTEFYRAEQQAQAERLTEATEAIIAFNRKDRGVLVEGLFPKQPEDDSEAQLLRLRMQDLLIPGDGDSAYEQLLERVGATTPPDAQRVLDTLNDTRARLFERESAQTGASEPEQEELDVITQELVAQRVSLYARPAQENSIYLTLGQFPVGSPIDVAPSFPRQAVSGTPSHDRTFLWQYDYWFAEDLIGFFVEANSRSGQLLPIVDAPIKRVLTIQGTPLQLGGASDDEWAESIDAGPDAANQTFEPRFFQSPSGRELGWNNQLYDLRRAKLSLIVDSERIPEIIDAAARSNLLTVVDLNVSSINVWNDLELGYYYGQDHVVQLDLELEFIYLRAWTAPLMPDSVRAELGLQPHPEPEAEDEFGDGFGDDQGPG